MKSNSIIKGLKWAAMEFALGFFVRFSLKLILAKLLLPKDFGLVGMTTIFVVVISAISELGMGAALIQKKENRQAERLYSTAFWTGLAWGVILYSIMCLIIGPFASKFYSEPLILKLFPFLSIGILLKPLTLIHTVILTRSMNFKKLALINNCCALISGLIAIGAAFGGAGVWSIVINNSLLVMLAIPLLLLTTKWLPKPEWKKQYFKEVFSFGIFSSGTSVLSTVTYNADNLMIGKFMDATSLGAYSLAFSLTEVLRQAISSIINKVMYPVFGQIQDNKEKLKKYFLQIIRVNSIIMYPIMCYVIIYGENIIYYLWGDKWSLASQPLKFLAIAVMVHLIVNSFTSLLRGLGYPKLEFKILLFLTFIILLPSLFYGIKYFGLLGAALAILFNKICLVIIALIVLKIHLNLKLIEIINSIKGTIISIGIASFFAYSSKFLDIHWTLQSVSYIVSYSILIYFLEKEIINMVLKKIFQRKPVIIKNHV